MDPVSYTHLDVYKRQEEKMEENIKKMESDNQQLREELRENIKKMEAVSYTHLWCHKSLSVLSTVH